MTNMETNLDKLMSQYVVKCSCDPQNSVVGDVQTLDRKNFVDITNAGQAGRKRLVWMFYRMGSSIAEITVKTKLTHEQVIEEIKKNTQPEAQ